MLSFVVRSSGLNPEEIWKSVDPLFYALAFCLFGFGFVLAAYRWYRLLRSIEVFMSFATVLRLAFIGQFFNLFIPGGVGGDLIKMVYLRRDSGERYPEAVLSVLLDRVLGLLGLLLLALGAALFNLGFFDSGGQEMKAIRVLIVFAGLIGASASLGFILWPHLSFLRAGQQRLVQHLSPGLAGLLAKVGQALSLVRSRPSLLFQLLFLAILGHFLAGATVFCAAKGVSGTEVLSFLECLLSTQLANLVAAVPLTPGGIGGRDLTLAYLLKHSGATEAPTSVIPLVVTSLLIIWSSFGGLAVLWERKSGKQDSLPGGMSSEGQ